MTFLKSHSITALLLLTSFLGGMVAWQSPSSPPVSSQASFEIIVEPTEDGLRMQCPEGCAWVEARQTCPDERPCRIRINDSGVGVAPPSSGGD